MASLGRALSKFGSQCIKKSGWAAASGRPVSQGAGPAPLVLEANYPEDKLPRELKMSASYMLQMRQRLAKSASPDVSLQRADFPDYYNDEWEHPNDYVLTDEPVWEVINHHGVGQRRCTILRASFKVDNNEYLPFSAILDTGASRPFYFSQKLYALLESSGRLKGLVKGGDTVVINDNHYLVLPSPLEHQPANVIGRDFLYVLGWGMHITKDRKEFNTFDNPMHCF